MKKTTIVMLAALILLDGCAYFDAKNDVNANRARIQTAKDAQQAEEDRRAGLQAEQEDVMNAQTQVSSDLNTELAKLDAQQAKLARLRASSQASKRKAGLLQNRLNELKADYSDTSMQLQTSQAANDPAAVAARQSQLRQLKQQIDAAAREVDALTN
ncbi:hypothetical protein SAMN07250955_101495 [Arboricoccus pini]|uniref:Lipoprotein n=1 Tax=Arboricoccus pini TaxID=1963835 RepID=A0A212Q8I8_9PROT|nr:hypothetical protein [Arboricoccus pini]SNB55663.1 hypothetical protein SAMN07250955_101495 [Arboricoccus pini]